MFRYMVGGTDILEELIEIYVGETKLVRNKVALFKPGEFMIIAGNAVKVNLPNPAPGQQLPLRILVDGAESPPRWIVT
ncbi:hypothetical protein [Hymenobacter volaticus]|uniref:Uncharacterized protein n=1 Tax=Hymenobacter volaticus TaxID=2932254 RepID=A0ABY4G1X2_9BACT|nr:hypothetical protein [Hymenobacter volaticus]UOQ64821.1 hypothetical protein MUN86_14750 [Hymenobacter volaticus]